MRRVFFLFLTMAVSAAAHAATTVHTDKSVWLSQLYGEQIDTFAGDPVANRDTPFQTVNGIRFATVSGQPGVVQIFDDGLVNGSREVHFREFGAGMLITLPSAVRAVGFTYGTAVESWTVEFGGAKHTIPPNTKGFIGFTDECLFHSTLKFSAPLGVAQGGISIDDLSAETARTFRAGLNDALASPFEATSRGAILNALGPPSRWKNFDDPANNLWVGHSFTAIPADLTRAELVIAMKPNGGGSGNDAISIGLTGSNQFAYTAYIDSLPGAGGGWNSNPYTTFVLDLGSLPGGAAILSKAAADQTLDVRVQDDTTVDWMQLRVWTCPAQQWFCTYPIRPLGEAELEVDDALPNAFVVKNIGSSGKDGVRFELGEVEGWAGQLADLPYTAPAGAHHRWTMRGTVDGVADQAVWTEVHDLVAANGRKDVRVSMDSSAIGATMNELTIYDRGAVVFSGTFPNGELYRFVPATDNPPALQRAASWDATCVVIHRPDPWKIQAKNGAIIERYDRVVTRSFNPTKSVAFRTALEFTAAAVPDTPFVDQAVILFGRVHRGIGRATLEAFGGTLTAANLRPGGEDGVRVDFGKAEELDVALAPIDPHGRAPAGAFLRATAYGSQDGIPDRPLGTLTITKAESDYRIAADFSAIGAASQHIEIYDGETLVGDIRGHTGPVGTASRWPVSIGKLGGRTECYSGGFDRDTVFNVGGRSYRGDRIHVLAENVTGTIDYKSALALQAGGIGEFTLIGAEANFCPASIDVLPPKIAQGAVGSPYPLTQFSSSSAYGPFAFSLTGALPAGMSFTADGRLSGTPAAAGTYPITITARTENGCAGTRSLVLTVVNSPRVIRVADGTATAGADVSLPVTLQSSGDENALAFTIGFNPAILGNPRVTLGAGAAAATLTLNTSQSAAGRVGVAIALPANRVFPAGPAQVAVVQFTTSAAATAPATSVILVDQPVARGVADVNAEILPATYADGRVAIARGFEADVSPRPNGDGDGKVTAADWVTVGRFAAGLEIASPGSEFQRADSAPRSTSGDGVISLADWVQAGRYAAGLDPVQPAGGPVQAAASRTVATDAKRSSSSRLIRAIPFGGQSTTVALQLDALGDENAIGAAVTFDPRWRVVSIRAGRDAGQATLFVSDARAAAGRVDVMIALPPGQMFSAGRRQVVIVELAGDEQPQVIAVSGEVADVTGNAHALAFVPSRGRLGR